MVKANVGDRVKVTLPWSEACMFLRIAERTLWVQVNDRSADVFDDEGNMLASRLTHGEAGVMVA